MVSKYALNTTNKIMIIVKEMVGGQKNYGVMTTI